MRGRGGIRMSAGVASDSTFCRVMVDLDPEALQDAPPRAAGCPRRLRPLALAADGKRIRGASRRVETVRMLARRPAYGELLPVQEGRRDGHTAALLEDVEVGARVEATRRKPCDARSAHSANMQIHWVSVRTTRNPAERHRPVWAHIEPAGPWKDDTRKLPLSLPL